MSNLTFTASRENIASIIDQIVGTPEIKGLPDDMCFTLRLVVEELAVNIVNYAYPEGKCGEMIVNVSCADKVLSISFSDQGIPFNPLEHEDPDINLSVEEREIGGLGILLVKQLMDGVEYQYIDGKNQITIHKNLS